MVSERNDVGTNNRLTYEVTQQQKHQNLRKKKFLMKTFCDNSFVLLMETVADKIDESVTKRLDVRHETRQLKLIPSTRERRIAKDQLNAGETNREMKK